MDKLGMGALVGAAILKIPALIITGACLAVGFYLGKMITNKIDERRVLKDQKLMDELKKDAASLQDVLGACMASSTTIVKE